MFQIGKYLIFQCIPFFVQTNRTKQGTINFLYKMNKKMGIQTAF